jgi:hypothetical protein
MKQLKGKPDQNLHITKKPPLQFYQNPLKPNQNGQRVKQNLKSSLQRS